MQLRMWVPGYRSALQLLMRLSFCVSDEGHCGGTELLVRFPVRRRLHDFYCTDTVRIGPIWYGVRGMTPMIAMQELIELLAEF